MKIVYCSILLLSAFCYHNNCLAQDYDKLVRDRNLSATITSPAIFSVDSTTMIKNFGEKKGKGTFKVIFPLSKESEQPAFRFTALDMTGTSKPENSGIKAINLVNSGFELTFDPAGKTGPVDDYITVRTKNGNLTLMLTGVIIEAKRKSKKTTDSETPESTD